MTEQRRQADKKAVTGWRNLPPHLLNRILDHLEIRDKSPSPRQFEQEVRRDIVSLQRTCKAWYLEPQRRLYEYIRIHDTERRSATADNSRTSGSTITLLRKTLRSRPMLAKLVKHIYIAVPPSFGLRPTNRPLEDFIWYSNLVASLIMTCPNLERLTGIQPVYAHKFDKLVHALSTRTKLKQHSWLIGENKQVTARARMQLPPGILDQEQVSEFLSFHGHWQNLERLRLISFNKKGILEDAILVRALELLPLLKHLTVTGFDADDFTDLTIAALPPLESLRLEGCQGVSDAGLCKWSQSSVASTIRDLTLIHQNLVSLLTVSTLFASLTRLETFHIMQNIEPSLPLELPVVQPLLVASVLTQLRWEVNTLTKQYSGFGVTANTEFLSSSMPGNAPLSSTQHLILSFLNRGLPCLKSLRLGPHQGLSELLHWAQKSAIPAVSSHTWNSQAGAFRDPRWSNFYSLPHTLPMSMIHDVPDRTADQAVASDESVYSDCSVSSSAEGETSTLQQYDQHCSPGPTIRSLSESVRTSHTSSKSRSWCCSNSSNSIVSDAGSVLTKASSVAPLSTTVPLSPIRRAEDADMGFDFGFRTSPITTTQCEDSQSILCRPSLFDSASIVEVPIENLTNPWTSATQMKKAHAEQVRQIDKPSYHNQNVFTPTSESPTRKPKRHTFDGNNTTTTSKPISRPRPPTFTVLPTNPSRFSFEFGDDQYAQISLEIEEQPCSEVDDSWCDLPIPVLYDGESDHRNNRRSDGLCVPERSSKRFSFESGASIRFQIRK